MTDRFNDGELELNDAARAAIDTKLRARNEFTYLAIENAIREHFQIDDSDADAFDEIHESITELHSHYEQLGLVAAGE